MKIFKNKSIFTLAAILLFNIAFFAVIANVFPVRFEECDDVMMASIANGTYLGEPDCHLVYMNALYGSLLVFLYRLVPSVEWYTYLLALFQILSITVASYYTVRDVKSRILKASLLFALYSVWSYIIFYLQYTTVAGVLALASVILLQKRHFSLGALFFFVSFLVRYHCAGMVIILSVPILVYEYGRDWKSYLKIGLILCFAGVLHLGNNAFYQDKEWKEYKEYNEIRGKISDNPNREKCKSELLKIMSESDYVLLSHFFHDPDIATTDVLKQTYSILESNKIENKIVNVKELLINKYWHLILINFILLSVLVLKNSKRAFVVTAVASYLLWVALLGYVSLNGTPKYRVVISSLLPLLWLWVIGGLQIKDVYRVVVFSVFCVVLCYVGFVREIRGGEFFRVNVEETINQEQKEILEECKNKFLVPYCNDFKIELFSPFHLKSQIRRKQIVFFGWMARYPLKTGYLTYRDFVDGDALLFISKSRTTANVQNSIKEHYSIDTDTIHVKETENYALIKFVKK